MKLRVCYITNAPAPYREEEHILLSKKEHIDYYVYYQTKKEFIRDWILEDNKEYKKYYSKAYSIKLASRIIHINFDLINYLNNINPDVIIVSGLNFSSIISLLWAKNKKRKILLATDATIHSELQLPILNKIIRKLFIHRFDSYIVRGRQGIDLIKSYKVEGKIRVSKFSVNNKLFRHNLSLKDKTYDLIFVGQLIDRKAPLFFIDVAEAVKSKLGSCKILIIGNGSEKEKVKQKLENSGLDYEYVGFVQPNDISKYYSMSKIFLFTTKRDAWGIVANEACAAGLPIMSTPYAGACTDIIINGSNGYILDFNVKDWRDHIVKILLDENLYNSMSSKSLELVESYTYENSVYGVIESILSD